VRIIGIECFVMYMYVKQESPQGIVVSQFIYRALSSANLYTGHCHQPVYIQGIVISQFIYRALSSASLYTGHCYQPVYIQGIVVSPTVYI